MAACPLGDPKEEPKKLVFFPRKPANILQDDLKVRTLLPDLFTAELSEAPQEVFAGHGLEYH